MRTLRPWAVVLTVAIACMQPGAKIAVKYITPSDWAAVSSQGCPYNSGNAWYRHNGLTCARDGKVQGVMGCVANLNEMPGGGPFTAACGVFPNDLYNVYGKADRLVVPTSGEYTFRLDTDVATFLFIDGEQLAMRDKLGNDFVMTDYTGGVLGSSMGTQKMCETGMNLTEGDHTFEFFYFSSMDLTQSRLILSWSKPGDPVATVIPPEAFGGGGCSTGAATGQSTTFVIGTPGIAIEGSVARFPRGTQTVQVFGLDGRCLWVAQHGASRVDLGTRVQGRGAVLVRADAGSSVLSARMLLR